MEQKEFIKEQLALLHSFTRLRKSDVLLNVHMDEVEFENKEIQEYIKRSIGENIEKDIQVENKIKAAAYLSVRKSKWKPSWMAKRMAELSAHALRDARLTYLYESERISAKQYKEESEKNFVTNTVNVFKRIKKKSERATVKALLTTAIGVTVGGPAAAIAGGIMLVTSFIPKPIKEKIKKQTIVIAKKASETIVKSTRTLYERGKVIATKVAEKIVDAATNISESLSHYSAPIIETVRGMANCVMDTVKEVRNAVKEKTKKLWNWLTK